MQITATARNRLACGERNPAADLKANLRRFHYVLDKFGVTAKALGVTAHGLRHEALIDRYEAITGAAPPVRGGAVLPIEIERPARTAVAELAGHARIRVADAYLGRPARGLRGRDVGDARTREADGPVRMPHEPS